MKRSWVLMAVALLGGMAAAFSPAVTSGQTAPAKPKLPVIKASKVAADFEDDYDGAAAKYERGRYVIRGTVGSTTVKKDGERVMVWVNFAAKTSPTDLPTEIEVSCDAKDAAAVSKLKKGDEVEITIYQFLKASPMHIAHQVSYFMGQDVRPALADAGSVVRGEVLDWVRKNNMIAPAAGGADNALVKDATKQVDGFLADGVNFTMTLSPDLVKSNKVTMVHAYNGKMFLYELTPAQAAIAKFPASSMVCNRGNSSEDMEYSEYQIVKADLGGGSWALTKELKGTVTLKQTNRLRDASAYYALRMTVYRGKAIDTFYYNIMVAIKDQPIAVSFSALDAGAAAGLLGGDGPGLQTVFLDIVRLEGKNKFGLVSEALPVVLTLTGK